MRTAPGLIAGLAAAIALAWLAQSGAPENRILLWIDGDTLRVATDSMSTRVRLIGIDAPEVSAGERAARQAAELGRDVATIIALGRQAKAVAERLAPPGTAVRVELDVQTHDRYGRLLAYLWLRDGRMINEELLRAGYAMVLTVPPNVRYADRFLRAQREAREARRGLWR
jgi:micrococcal nuclease